MKQFQFASRAGVGIVVLLVANSLASAQATRTWVSGVGDDVNPCSRTAPCKTFAGAISKTATGGEINCIDPGGFGGVTITKAITIDGNGTHAAILAAGTTGVIINAPSTATVTLRNLSINGVNGATSPGLDGIRVLQAGNVFIENCTVFGFNEQGLDYQVTGTTAARLQIKDSVFQRCNTGGIKLTPLAGQTSTVNAVLDNVRMEGNSFGFQANDRTKATLRNCSMSGNTAQGMLAFVNLGGATVSVNLEHCTLANNGSIGIRANAATAVVRLSNTSIFDNAGASIDVAGGGLVQSFVNNQIRGNTPDTAPTALVPAQQ
ncbi:MAG: right-handed parallel beta-helix repeat-containing protein [Planctomycetota bacterium]